MKSSLYYYCLNFMNHRGFYVIGLNTPSYTINHLNTYKS